MTLHFFCSSKWFNYEDIPYDKMWKDDVHWYPWLFKNQIFQGYSNFDEDDNFIHYNFIPVESLEEIAIDLEKEDKIAFENEIKLNKESIEN